MAMQGILASGKANDAASLATNAVRFADELLKELGNER